MTKYAANTQVPWSRSRDEIERTLMRYGAEQFAYMGTEQYAVVAFVHKGRQVRLTIQLPDVSSREFTHTPTGQRRTSKASITNAHEQAVRQRWRALALVVKAKLEAVEAGIVTFEQEFFSHFVLPTGKTVYEQVAPAVEASMLGDAEPLLRITSGK